MLFLTMLAGTVFGQNSGKLTYDSYELYRNGEYKKAAELIDRAIAETEDSISVESWYLRAGIYWGIFNKIDLKSELSDARVVSLISVLEAVELDLDQIYYQQSLVLLEKISTSYYNDAVSATINFNIDNPKFAENSYLEYKRIQKILYPDKNFDEMDVSFYKAEATSFAKAYQVDPSKNKDLFYLTIEALGKVLKIDSNDYGANYNTAIYYYNEGVYQIETIDTQTDITELIIIQKYSSDRFQEAMPYMLKANEIRTREETLRGLVGIYNVIYDEEKVEYYRAELEKLKEVNFGNENAPDK
ncbi:MAG: hypothetical protein DRI54_01255 [Bacteroidetes bacterium]|nr:MAG: hypothetical protein DRI54_01255 [Bacteroidota bacterium]